MKTIFRSCALLLRQEKGIFEGWDLGFRCHFGSSCWPLLLIMLVTLVDHVGLVGHFCWPLWWAMLVNLVGHVCYFFATLVGNVGEFGGQCWPLWWVMLILLTNFDGYFWGSC